MQACLMVNKDIVLQLTQAILIYYFLTVITFIDILSIVVSK